jgi:Ser/Thr protein kinase RdoA (MazF antagonist)
LFNHKKEALALIDYEKVEYNNFMWDLLDLVRSLIKLSYFDESLFVKCILEYEKYRKLNENEKKSLINYLETLILHVILQYFIALFPN